MKKILLSLLVGFFGLGCFCSAELIGSFTCNSAGSDCGTIQPPANCDGSFSVYFDGGGKPFTVKYNGGTKATLEFYSGLVTSDCRYILIAGSPGFISTTYPVTVNYGTDPNGGGCPECPICPECPEINTGEILSGYILESEIDTNYCVENGYCPNECGSGTDFSGDLVFSNLYINNILHPGKENIFVDIPDYITWDYSTDTGSFNLYVGSGYDVEYIESIIDINSYRPDSKDFTDIFVGGLTLITPYIVAILFFYLVWRLLKRIFS